MSFQHCLRQLSSSIAFYFGYFSKASLHIMIKFAFNSSRNRKLQPEEVFQHRSDKLPQKPAFVFLRNRYQPLNANSPPLSRLHQLFFPILHHSVCLSLIHAFLKSQWCGLMPIILPQLAPSLQILRHQATIH